MRQIFLKKDDVDEKFKRRGFILLSLGAGAWWTERNGSTKSSSYSRIWGQSSKFCCTQFLQLFSVPFTTIGIPEKLQGNLKKCRGVTWDGLAPYPDSETRSSSFRKGCVDMCATKVVIFKAIWCDVGNRFWSLWSGIPFTAAYV